MSTQADIGPRRVLKPPLAPAQNPPDDEIPTSALENPPDEVQTPDPELPRRKDGWPNSDKIPDWKMYLNALTPDQWMLTTVYTYLHKTDPRYQEFQAALKSDSVPTEFAFLERIGGMPLTHNPLDESYLSETWGGGIFYIWINRRKFPKSLYQVEVKIMAPEKDIIGVMRERQSHMRVNGGTGIPTMQASALPANAAQDASTVSQLVQVLQGQLAHLQNAEREARESGRDFDDTVAQKAIDVITGAYKTAQQVTNAGGSSSRLEDMMLKMFMKNMERNPLDDLLKLEEYRERLRGPEREDDTPSPAELIAKAAGNPEASIWTTLAPAFAPILQDGMKAILLYLQTRAMEAQHNGFRPRPMQAQPNLTDMSAPAPPQPAPPIEPAEVIQPRPTPRAVRDEWLDNAPPAQPSTVRVDAPPVQPPGQFVTVDPEFQVRMFVARCIDVGKDGYTAAAGARELYQAETMALYQMFKTDTSKLLSDPILGRFATLPPEKIGAFIEEFVSEIENPEEED